MKKMKKYIQITLVALLPAMLLNSCVRFEEENIFDESAALRLEHSGSDLKDILVNQSDGENNGWVLQYFCGTSVAQFEGFNLFAKFDAGEKVLMAGNHRMLRDGRQGLYTEHESLYKLISEDGLVLAFNTWNNILTPFVDPVSFYNAPNALVKDGEGMAGDHNFVVTSYKENEIIMRGERHGAEVRLVACDRPWAEYITAAEDSKVKIANSGIASCYVANATDTLYFVGLRDGKFRYCERVNDPLHIDSLACVFTPNGFRLEHEQTLGSGDNQTKFHEFTFANDGIGLLSEDGLTRVIPCWDNYVINRMAVWLLDEELFSAEQKSLVEQIDVAIRDMYPAGSLASIGIGRSTGANAVTGLVFTFYGNAAKTSKATGGLQLNTIKTAYGEAIVESPEDAAVDRNMSNICNKATDMNKLIRAFAATLNGKYKLVPDDYYLPTGCTFTAIEGGTTFKLNLKK